MTTLKVITSHDGERNIYGVQDSSNQVWWPHDDAQDEIQASDNPTCTALEMCEESPMRGDWSC